MEVKIKKIKKGNKVVEELIIGEEPEGITWDTHPRKSK